MTWSQTFSIRGRGRRAILAATLIIAAAAGSAAAEAPKGSPAGGTPTIIGPNTDFPDTFQIMPFSARDARSTFFALSNVGVGPVAALWRFYDESGEFVGERTRDILGEGGTDIVDVTAIGDKPPSGRGDLNMSGRNGFVVVIGDDNPRLVSTFTIANLQTNSAYGSSGTGLGFVGVLPELATLVGNSFNPSTLGDNLLIVLAIDDLDIPTSWTDGFAPLPGEIVFDLTVRLHDNSNDGVIDGADRSVGVTGSALFTTLQDFFPGVQLNSSATIAAFSEPPSGSDRIPATILGYYGQAIGQFGAGQNLRTIEE